MPPSTLHRRYRFTLRVEKDGDVDTAHTEVYVNSQPTPKLWIERLQEKFDPYKDTYVPALVSVNTFPVMMKSGFEYSANACFCCFNNVSK